MAGFAKAILITILAAAAIILLFNLAFFFPWYMEIIQTTFQASQMIATDNYLTWENYDDLLNNAEHGLKNKPIFKERAGAVKIEAVHANGKDAIERGGPHDVNTDYYPLEREEDKPYVQMGNLVTIEISANYPFRMQMFGEPVVLSDIPITFSMTTSTTHHYKDLPYDFGVLGETLDDYDD